MMTETLADFLSTNEFAVAATIGASTVNGLLDKPTANALDYAAGRRITFICAAADLPAFTLGTTTLTIGSTTYTIVNDDDDGFGLTTLTLEVV